MGKRTVLPVLVVTAAGACAILWARGSQSPTLSLLSSSTSRTTQLWPADKSWAWTFPLPERSAGERIALRLRQKSMPLSPRATLVIRSFNKAMRSIEAEHTVATSMIVTSPVAGDRFGTASVQLIDLAEIGAAPTIPEKSLRVLATISIGGAETRLSTEDIILPGRRFAGQSFRSEGAWADGELYLMSFWVENEGTSTQYDVFLEQSADRSAP